MEILDFDSAKDAAILKMIQDRCTTHKLRWTNHMLTRLLQRGISLDAVTYVLTSGEIIEHYPEDYPHPSYLILGRTAANEQLHIVCGIGPDYLHLITAYYPDPERWESDGKTRKEKSQ